MPGSYRPQYNKYAQLTPNIIKKALDTAAGVGAAHIPQDLEKLYTDTVNRLSPELALVTAKQANSLTPEFNRVIARPALGGAQGENSTAPKTNSKSVRDSVKVKVIKRVGAISNLLKDSSRTFLDVQAFEMQQHLEAHVLDLIYYMLYGNKDSAAYVGGTWTTSPDIEMDGIDKFVVSNRLQLLPGTAVPTDLSFLDGMLDATSRNGGNRTVRAFGSSPEFLSKISRLLTNVRLNQDYGSGLTQVDIAGGWRMNAYRQTPIIETTSTKAMEKLTSTVSLSTVATGGGLSDGTYYVRVAPVTNQGEQEASDEASITISGGGAAQRIRITLSASHKTDGLNSAYSYRIYVGTSSGVANTKLKKIVSAFMYDASKSQLDPMIDANCAGTGTNYIFFDSMTPGADVPTGLQNDIPNVAVGGIRPEMMYLWCTDPIQGLGKLPYVNTDGDIFNGLVTTKRLADVEDYIQFLIKSYCALCPSFEKTSYIIRGLRTA